MPKLFLLDYNSYILEILFMTLVYWIEYNYLVWAKTNVRYLLTFLNQLKLNYISLEP